MVLISALGLIMLYIFVPSFRTISESVSELRSGHEKCTKGNKSVKNVGRVTVFVSCTLSDNTLYLNEVNENTFYSL